MYHVTSFASAQNFILFKSTFISTDIFNDNLKNQPVTPSALYLPTLTPPTHLLRQHVRHPKIPLKKRLQRKVSPEKCPFNILLLPRASSPLTSPPTGAVGPTSPLPHNHKASRPPLWSPLQLPGRAGTNSHQAHCGPFLHPAQSMSQQNLLFRVSDVGHPSPPGSVKGITGYQRRQGLNWRRLTAPSLLILI